MLPSSFKNVPEDILATIAGDYLSIQDLNSLARTEKMGEIWANAQFDLMATELKCSGNKPEERKLELAKLYQQVEVSTKFYTICTQRYRQNKR